MNEIEWHTEESGRLIGGRIHDSTLLTFAVVSQGDLRLEVKRSAGLARLDFVRAREFTVAELWDGAILSDVFAWKAGSVPEATWAVSDGGWRALFGERMSLAHAGLAAQRIASRQPEPWLIQVFCSYGGSIAAVCDAIRIFEFD
jgi:hypothetical protein